MCSITNTTKFTQILNDMLLEVRTTLKENSYTESEIDYFFETHRKKIVKSAKQMYNDYLDDNTLEEIDEAERYWYREYLEDILQEIDA